MPAMMRRDAHKPQARSGGSTALSCRNVAMLASAAERDRSDPRVGIDSVMQESQHGMVTFVNGNVGAACRWARYLGPAPTVPMWSKTQPMKACDAGDRCASPGATRLT